MSLIDTLDAVLQPWAQQLFDVAKIAGVNPRITSALRTYAQQAALYKAFKEGRSRYPAAPPGRSAHEYGLAFDMVVNGASNQVDCGIVWNQWGGDYGGEEDPIHFQYPGFSPETYAPGPHPASPGSVVEIVPLYTPSTAEIRSRQLADKILPLILDELGYNVDIHAIEIAIESVLGPADPAVLGTLRWGLEHPSEFYGQFHDALLSNLLGLVL